jgi:hypothetical protein
VHRVVVHHDRRLLHPRGWRRLSAAGRHGPGRPRLAGQRDASRAAIYVASEPLTRGP